jgi:hypothetical protein
MNTNKTFIFEVFCVNTKDTMVYRTEKHIIHLLMANANLWKNPNEKLDSEHTNIIDDQLKLNLSVSSVKIEPNLVDEIKSAFLIKVEAPYKALERFRENLINYLGEKGFDKVYILTDEVSAKIAKEIYPKINKVENLLRKYVMFFFVTKLGFKWWEKTADSTMSKKANDRKKNETVFAPKIDNNVYSIDFKELGQLIHKQSSGFLNREDVIKKIMSLEESTEAIFILKK